MKFSLVALMVFISFQMAFCQGSNNRRIKYHAPKKYSHVYIKKKVIEAIVPAGTTVAKTADGYSFEYQLTEDDTIYVDKYEKIPLNPYWFFDEVKYDDDNKGWVRLNPRRFSVNSNDEIIGKSKKKAGHPTEDEMRLKVDVNKYVRLNINYISFDALTLPFVYRPALNDSIGSQLSTNLSLGMSATYNMGWENFRNRRLTTKRSITSFSAGIGLGFKKVELTAASTSLADNPISNAQDGLAFFIAPGIGVHTRGITFTLMYGWDLPITSNVQEWNYAKEGYLAFGFGIGINTIGKVLSND